MKKQLSQILYEFAGISEEDYNDVRRVSREKGANIGELMVKRKWLTEAQYLGALSIYYDIPFWPDLPLETIGTDVIHSVPIQFLKKYFMIPLESKEEVPQEQPEPETYEDDTPEASQASEYELHSKDEIYEDSESDYYGNYKDSESDLIDKDELHEAEEASEPSVPEKYSKYIIAVNDPACFQALDDLIRIINADSFRLVLSTKESILSAINISYDFSRDSAEQLVQNMEENGTTIISEIEDTADILADTSDAPIIKLVNHIISQSAKARSSDIHIEPYQDSFKVRYRVDGILYDLLTPPKWIQPALTSRIKVMSKMNIAEKRLPQDGRIEVKIGNQEIDVRVSTIPTSFGERVVMRLLNKSSSLLELTELGMSPDRLKLIETLSSSPNGIILVTGPTGSGKTTMLYAVLSSINTPDINIITIEDPIEYQLKGISQIQVNPKIELTFARGLRSIVRQDPDVVLVGEIRDRETAEIAVQSALTGHLVFSTLHTNDSASAITRLVDIGVEPFLISSSVIAIAAQRLVRVLCNECKEPFAPDEMTMKTIGITREQMRNAAIYEAKGCQTCFNTGYKGRVAILEIMVMDSNLKSLILKTFDSNLIKKEANMVSLRQDGIQKILAGVTTIEEVLRVTQM
ncbi:MAG: type II secretion system ATPase GspE [Desulfobacterales bacterium]|nr:type II secretion system ATPase GspE [Desulfobacterales bacterium]